MEWLICCLKNLRTPQSDLFLQMFIISAKCLGYRTFAYYTHLKTFVGKPQKIKVSFLVARPLRPHLPPPLKLSDHIFSWEIFLGFFLELQKVIFSYWPANKFGHIYYLNFGA